MLAEKKRLYAIIIIVLFCFVIVTGLGNFRAKQLAVNMASDVVNRTITLAAESLDVPKVLKIIGTLDANDPYYQEICADFLALKQQHDLENIYLIVQNDKSEIINVVNAKDLEDPARNSLGKEVEEVSSSVLKAFRGKTVQGEYTVKSSGPVVSGFLALKDDKGSIFAVLGGEFKASEMTDFLFTTRYAQIGIAAVSLMLIVLILLLSRKKK